MAWLQTDPSGNFHVSFRFGGVKFKRSLRTKSKAEAEARLVRLEENIRLVDSRRLEIPESGDVPLFLLSDGKASKRRKYERKKSLSEKFDAYFNALPECGLEGTTIETMAIHRRHLERHFGARFSIQQLCQPELQAYVTARSKAQGIRGRKLSATTIRKEIVTLRSVWIWAAEAKYLTGKFPNRGLKYPKVREKPRFHTWDEITHKIQVGNLSAEDQLELWDCLFLSGAETEELLTYAKENARHPFIYPMLLTAAHTGARRSELMRSQLVDLDGEFITFREKKRVRGTLSTRRVPISSKLSAALEDWQEIHPGGSFTYSTVADGIPKAISKDSANHHFQKTFEGSKWEVIRGWHCLRHSFCSNCALRGTDQRIIDSRVGHATESMRKRYRHLFPSHESKALRAIFG